MRVTSGPDYVHIDASGLRSFTVEVDPDGEVTVTRPPSLLRRIWRWLLRRLTRQG